MIDRWVRIEHLHLPKPTSPEADTTVLMLGMGLGTTVGKRLSVAEEASPAGDGSSAVDASEHGWGCADADARILQRHEPHERRSKFVRVAERLGLIHQRAQGEDDGEEAQDAKA